MRKPVVPEGDRNMTSRRSEMLDQLAVKLADAWTSGKRIALPDPAERPRDRAEAYAVQDRLAALIGLPVAGWKAGATSAGMRARDGQDDIIVGRVFAPQLLAGADLTLPAAQFANTRAEPEFAFVLLADLPAQQGRSAAEIAPLVSAHIAIELVASRYAERPPKGAEGGLLGLADNASAEALIIGPEIAAPEQVDFLHHPVTLTVNGGAAAPQTPPDIRAAPYAALADVVNHLGARGIGLRAGMAIAVGANTETLPVSAGCLLVADFGTLGAIRAVFA